ncbi:MAG: MFS transporter [Pseudonocardiales bacterium]|nr:MAG: MFS transporter [Pseudonocardiales bacterium]
MTRLATAVRLIGAFLPMVDFFIVNLALPTINTTLHASAPMLELIVAGYGTAYAVSLVVGGRLGDAIGRRRMFVIGLASFSLTSLLCGIAPSIGVLVAARVLQGMSAAMIVPQVLATFQATLEGNARSRAIGLYAATGGVAVVTGQLLGGVLLDANIAGTSWRPIFLVNVPFGIAGLLLAPRIVPATRSPNPAGVDIPGTTLLAVTVVALLIPLTEGPALHWPLWLWGVLALAPIGAAGMVAVERRSERGGRTPLVPPSLVRLPNVRRGLLLAVPFFLGFGAFTFVFALTVQNGLHRDALHSGLAMTPMALGFFTGSLLTARLYERFGTRLLALGFALQAVGLISLVAVVAGEWPNVSLLGTIPGLAVAGFGQSLGLGALFRTVLAGVPQHLAGVGSGVLVTVQQGSLALGVASLGTLFVSLSADSARDAFVVVVGIQTLLAIALVFASPRRSPSAAEPAGSVPAAAH